MTLIVKKVYCYVKLFKRGRALRLKKEIQYLKNNKTTDDSNNREKLDPAYKVFGFKNNDEFVNWCFDNGIKIKNVIDKLTSKKIIAIKKRNLIQRQLRLSNELKSMSFSEILYNHQKGRISLARDNKFYPYVNVFKKNKERDKGLEKFMNHIVENINLFKKVNDTMFSMYRIEDYAEGLKKIYDYKDFWIRDYKTWEPTRYRNSWWNIINLIEHLFEEYKLPRVLKTVWFNKDNQDMEIELYIDLCQGKSAHKVFKNYALNSAIPELTKKQVHAFMNGRHENVFEVEYKKIFLLENGVKKDFVREATIGNWACSLSNLNMLKEYLLLVQKETMFDKSQILPLWDYMLYLRRQIENENKVFVLKNRSIQKLLNDMHEWHQSLNKSKDSSYWEASWKVKPYVYEDFEKKAVGFYIKELTTAKELIEEGRKLSHCVASYANSCKNGNATIWSFYKDDFGNRKKLVTLELRDELTLVQCRGKANRLPDNSEWYHIEKWLKENGLKRGV